MTQPPRIPEELLDELLEDMKCKLRAGMLQQEVGKVEVHFNVRKIQAGRRGLTIKWVHEIEETVGAGNR